MAKSAKGSDSKPLTLDEAIAEWANSRPMWQRGILRKLCDGDAISDQDIETLADQVLNNSAPKVQDLTAADIPGGQADGDAVDLISVGEVRSVNALLEDQSLTFEDPTGLTVIYGHNASGKSGYARVIKDVVGARHEEPVLPNVFAKEAPDQVAKIRYRVGSKESEELWPKQTSPDLRKIQFYDEACGDAYLGGETELTYRPLALNLLDRLIGVCDRVGAALTERLQQSDAAKGLLPAVPTDSPAATFLGTLSATTTADQLDAAAKVPAEGEKEVARLAGEEQRLKASDPTKERKRLESTAQRLDELADHVNVAEATVGTKALEELVAAHKSASDLRAAAALASSKQFDEEPLSGVGAPTWRALWEAARAFSEAEAYHDHSFPHTGEHARCVLCHQTLDEDAAARLNRFDAFMKDRTEQQAAEAERKAKAGLEDLKLFASMPSRVATLLADLQEEHGPIVDETRTWLAAAGETKGEAIEKLGKEEEPTNKLSTSPEPKLRLAASDLRTKASAIDDAGFAAELKGVVLAKVDLEGRIALDNGRATIEAEVARLQKRAALTEAKQAVDTGAITRKASDLTRSHVTSVVRDQFTRETDRLRLIKITLADAGGHKGQLRHKPALLDASRSADVDQVLSEGEQTALGLSGYFTETHFDGSKSAMVLDDPVTSLDHIRRDKVAQRLVEFAKDRQVVVFTHDLSFVADLSQAADEAGIGYAERGVQKRGDGTPGLTVDKHPWKARDVKARLGELEADLAEIKRERANWSEEEYETKCADWGGKLSETWEQMINVEIVGRVLDIGKSEVRVKSFRMLSKITEEDNQALQESYSRASKWARRHDKDKKLNYVAPEPEDLEKELKFVRDWFERVRKYRD